MSLLNAHQPTVPVFCYESEDVEGWLVEEGIGHYDECRNFQYGVPPLNDLRMRMHVIRNGSRACRDERIATSVEGWQGGSTHGQPRN